MYKSECNLSGLIGKTPLVRLSNIEAYFGLRAELYAKLEMYNPTGSVKDRAAFFIIRDAVRRGLIYEGCTVVEPTSGNMGISLAMMSSIYGYIAEIVMPDNMSEERISLIRAYGGRVHLTPGDGGMRQSVEVAEKINKENEGSFMPSQFTNYQSINAHYLTTGQEIFREMKGEIDIFVCGVGTGGTIGGVGRFLKERIKNVKIVAVEPERSAVLSGKSPGAHRIQGIGAGFIPPLLDFMLIDRIIEIEDEKAEEFLKILAKEEGIFAGFSSGASLASAVMLAREGENKDKKIVTLLADGGERYLSLVR